MSTNHSAIAPDEAFAEGFQAAQSIIASLLGVEASLFERFVQLVARQAGRPAVPLSAIAALRGLSDHPGLTFGASDRDVAALDQVLTTVLARATEGEAAAGLTSTRGLTSRFVR